MVLAWSLLFMMILFHLCITPALQSGQARPQVGPRLLALPSLSHSSATSRCGRFARGGDGGQLDGVRLQYTHMIRGVRVFVCTRPTTSVAALLYFCLQSRSVSV